MKRICKNKIVIDALTICYEVTKDYPYSELCKLEFGESLDCGEFRLYRTSGRYYENIYTIKLWNGSKDIEYAQVKFNLNHGNDESNTHADGKRKLWISLNNETLYSQDINFLSYIEQVLGIEPHNFTTIDLALDTPFNVSNVLKQNIRDKRVNTILNGKKIVDRDADVPEITYTMSGSLNKYKYLTINIKQRNAMKDKSRGVTIISYDKSAEILNSSDKRYILDYYGQPKRLYRTEVHLNNDEVKTYLERKHLEFNPLMIFDEALLEQMYFHHLNGVIRFQSKQRDVSWEYMLGRL